jgi:hypothetical protein
MEKQNSKVTKGNDIRNIIPVGEEQGKQITPKDKIEMLAHHLNILENSIIEAKRGVNRLDMLGVDTGTSHLFQEPINDIHAYLDAVHNEIGKSAERLSALNEFIKPSNQ